MNGTLESLKSIVNNLNGSKLTSQTGKIPDHYRISLVQLVHFSYIDVFRFDC